MDRYTSPFSTSIRGIKGLIPRKMPAHGPVFGINLNSWRHTPADPLLYPHNRYLQHLLYELLLYRSNRATIRPPLHYISPDLSTTIRSPSHALRWIRLLIIVGTFGALRGWPSSLSLS
jgi:hypothetical protein